MEPSAPAYSAYCAAKAERYSDMDAWWTAYAASPHAEHAKAYHDATAAETRYYLERPDQQRDE